MICGFCGSVLCVSLFQSSLLVIVIMIDGSKKRICEQLLNFRVRRVFLKSAGHVILRLTKLPNVSINKKDVRR